MPIMHNNQHLLSRNKFMELAITQAEKAKDLGEVPIGAVIVCEDKIIAKAYNCNLANQNPLDHAEIIAINRASQHLNSRYLDNCQIYVTLEPCMMCMGAISLARIGAVYYGLADEKFGAIESNKLFWQKNHHYHLPEVYSNIGEDKIRTMMKNFFQQKR